MVMMNPWINYSLMSNDNNAIQDSNVNPDGYYEFEIVGKKDDHHDDIGYTYDIFIKKDDITWSCYWSSRGQRYY